MANAKPTKTTFSKTKQPPKGRGKSERTKILEAMARAGHTEDGFYDLLMVKAFDPEDNFTFKELLNRMSPVAKAVSPTIKFHLPLNTPPHKKAEYVLNGIAKGDIPPDVGAICIQAIKAMIDIAEYTDLKDRIEKLEKLLNK